MDEIDDLKEALPAVCPIVIHVEVCQKPTSTARTPIIREHVKNLLSSHPICIMDFVLAEFDDPFLKEHINTVAVCDTEFLTAKQQELEVCGTDVQIHVFQLHKDGPASEDLDDEDLAAASHWLLPSASFDGIWESLIFDSSIKLHLLQYASTTLLFSDKKVNTNIISWNRVILLHGPPGTGKTSLCRALAQKLCINLSDRYSYGQLIEINSHSLFSKWFSESGKLVMKMFQKIQELVDDKDALVCVLIDEVESLTAARKAAMSGSEPSDAIRVVNAVLTQLDQIKQNNNVIILTTSNITGAIDLAFVDRADIKQYIGPPSAPAIYRIYSSCICELMRVGIINPSEQLMTLKSLELLKYDENDATRLGLRLMDVAKKSEGLSGRTLRKLPFIAHALHVQKPKLTVDNFLDALLNAVERQFEEQQLLASS